ncbi:MAG TPA: phosphatidate cytidylyltransferase [Acidimicrobiales bacterium]|nr:phosphatidate cytidylyltransferase [Acidimicrobiales bacterium]
MDKSHRTNPEDAEEDFDGITLIGDDAADEPSADELVRPGRSVFAAEEQDDLLDDEVSLPHWTEPPSGATRAVRDDLDAWSSITGAQPRWRDSATDFDDEPEFRFEDDEDADDEHDFFDFDAGADNGFLAPASEAAAVGGPSVVPIDGRRGRSRDPAESPPARGAAAMVREDMALRVGTGLALAAVALLAFKAGPRYTVVLIALVLGLAVAEFFSATRRAGYQPAVLLGIAGSVTMPLAVYWRGLEAIPLILFLATAFGMIWFLVGAGTESPLLNTGVTVFGVVYVGMLGSYGALMLKAWGDDGIGVLLGAVVATVAYDVGGLLIGRAAGKSQLSAMSPNKTIEGLFGGMILSVVVTTVIMGQIEPWGSVGHAFALGVAAAIAAPVGDLCESLLKRDLGVKDMGAILPGHGGLLDRFDALLFVLPVTYEVARWLDVGLR